jgi:ABC-type nickel/cobalt efflux system permease component RcnA
LRRARLLAVLSWSLAVIAPIEAAAHPLGNFSISHYTRIRLEPSAIEVRYVIDMAEIPTFQEVQETGIVPEVDHPSLGSYLPRRADALRDGLVLEIDGRPVSLARQGVEVLFSPGAGGLPTLKLGVLYRATLDDLAPGGRHELRYRDGNFPDRAGWKEIVLVTGPGVAIEQSSVPATDRSRALTDYPTDLLASPPQVLEARLTFSAAGPVPLTAIPLDGLALADAADAGRPVAAPPIAARPPREPEPVSRPSAPPIRLEGNRRATPRSAFTELLTDTRLGFGIVALALMVAAGLGAVHALEPGHGKTVVAAYLVGSRGTGRHALILGLVVTAAHTAGVYLLGAVTLYASRYVVPERLYPWLGVLSGLTIAGLGLALFCRRYAGGDDAHTHGHPHDHGHAHAHPHGGARHPHDPAEAVSLRELVALGITGGLVPCPGALVVLLSAVALRRVGFGLLLIVAFSVGLAAVLIAIGLCMVYARRLMARLPGEGRLVTRWLPLTSSAIVTVLGVAIAAQALVAAGILQIRLG